MARKQGAEGTGKPFDVTAKVLLDAHTEDWLRFLGLPVAPVTVLDSDLSTLSVAADRVWRVDAPDPFLVHFEFQASYDAGLVERSHRYNVILRTTHSLPVMTVLVLLRREANLPAATGRYEDAGPTPDCFVMFGYRVLRLWEIAAGDLLGGGVGLVPLAPLGNAPDAAAIVQAATARISAEADPTAQAELLTSLEVLLGLRFEAGFVRQLMKGVRTMEESTVYQEIFAKGEARGKVEGKVEGRAEGKVEGRAEGNLEGELRGQRRFLVRVATRRLGEPDALTLRKIEQITSGQQLDQLLERSFDVESWDDLLA